MKKILVTLVGMAAILVLTSAPAAAQNSELGAGVTTLKWSDWPFKSVGFAVDFAQAIHKTNTSSIAIIADVSRNRFSSGEETDLSYVFGARFKFMRDKRIQPFVQGTFGWLRWTPDNDDTFTETMFGGGGGVQIQMTDMVDVKGQFDVWRSHNSDFNDNHIINRIFGAVVIKLGAKK